MIDAPPGWSQYFGANLVTLLPPTGGGRVRYYERLPVRGLSDTVDDILARDPAYRVEAVLKSLRVVTEEGEHGVLVPVRGTRGGGPALRFLGIVITDEFMAALDTLVLLRTQLAYLERTSRELLLSIALGLGVRRRRFFYTPPPGWHALPGGLAATFYPADFPGNMTNLAVLPATPGKEPPHAVLRSYLARESLHGFTIEGGVEEEGVVSAAGLEGVRFRFAGKSPRHAWLARDVVIFAGGGYSYFLRLETTATDRLDEHRAVLEEVARTAEPVPVPGRRVGGFADDRAVSTLTTIWAE